jgi:membrane protease YdiL (CAAX protease family)
LVAIEKGGGGTVNGSTSVRDTVRQIALTVTFSSIGLLIPYLVEELLQLELSKITVAIIAFAFSALGAIIVLPRVFGIPFGKTSFTKFARGIGFYLPKDGWKHIGLGLTLAACTLSGMLVGSILTGEYVVDASNITLSQAVFALVPGIWEEVFFRGILMVVLLRATKSLKKAFLAQCILFALCHIKGTSVHAFVEVFSAFLIAIGLTYVAYKTRSLVAGITFHYFHDALLFFVQSPESEHFSLQQHAFFYAGLWIMVGVGCLITRVAADRLLIRAEGELYEVPSATAGGD